MPFNPVPTAANTAPSSSRAATCAAAMPLRRTEGAPIDLRRPLSRERHARGSHGLENGAAGQGLKAFIVAVSRHRNSPADLGSRSM